MILPATGEGCRCGAPTEPLHSTIGLERCTTCGTVVQSRLLRIRADRDRSSAATPAPRDAGDRRRSV
ncbi:MAG: hypothetical protein ACJ76I_10950 [Gaiellaceae bacterium]